MIEIDWPGHMNFLNWLDHFSAFIALSLVMFVVGASAQSKVDLELNIELPSEAPRGGESFSYTAKVRNIGSIKGTSIVLVHRAEYIVEITSGISSVGTCEL